MAIANSLQRNSALASLNMSKIFNDVESNSLGNETDLDLEESERDDSESQSIKHQVRRQKEKIDILKENTVILCLIL